MNGFWSQIGVMALTFCVALLPALGSRRMERSDYLTLVAIPPVMFVIAVMPAAITWGFTKDVATYVLGMAIVLIAATINYRLQPKPHNPAGPAEGADAASVNARPHAKEA